MLLFGELLIAVLSGILFSKTSSSHFLKDEWGCEKLSELRACLIYSESLDAI